MDMKWSFSFKILKFISFYEEIALSFTKHRKKKEHNSILNDTFYTSLGQFDKDIVKISFEITVREFFRTAMRNISSLLL